MPEVNLKTVARRRSIKYVLKNFAKFAGKHLCRSLLSNKVANNDTVPFLKKGSSITYVFL